MLRLKFEYMMEQGYLDQEYADFIVLHSDARICNGADLIKAIESGRYYDDFFNYLED